MYKQKTIHNANGLDEHGKEKGKKGLLMNNGERENNGVQIRSQMGV